MKISESITFGSFGYADSKYIISFFSLMLGRPSKNSLKFLVKNFDKCFKGLSDIKEQNQLQIWNQQVKHY